jgi:GLPGLI family protein
MRKPIACAVLLFICSTVYAQFARFPTSGVIEFEKKVNTFALVKNYIDKEKNVSSYLVSGFEQYKKTQPQFLVSKSTLSFTKDKSFFVPSKSSEEPHGFLAWLPIPVTKQLNTVYNDLNTKTSMVQKLVFEETFLVKDSTRRINWKITDEYREIAGYSCRRANALVMDSVYVVAFYTDQIPVSSGPEVFSGLPGMILGVAMPHEHVTWFATSVADKPLEKPILPPTKGKAVSNKELQATLQSSLKRWGDYARPFLRILML